jgi:MraZ protein
VDQEPNFAMIEPPRGIFQGRVDSKGRLKLPAALYKYLIRLGEERVFITSLDMRTVRIYPTSLWKENQRFFETFVEDPQAAEDVAFLADDVGRDSDVDDQGRVLLPAELRRALGLEDQPVWINLYKGRINLYGKELYDERKQRARDGLGDKLLKLEQRGLR